MMFSVSFRFTVAHHVFRIGCASFEKQAHLFQKSLCNPSVASSHRNRAPARSLAHSRAEV